MPHKHTRKPGEDKSTTDLPPTTIAKPLPVSKSSNSNGIFTTEINPKRANKKRKRNADVHDDTPKAFARLMAFKEGKRLPKGLDDGAQKPKAKKAKANNKQSTENEDVVGKQPAVETPKIKPGERMSEFAARVDAMLPIGGLINKSAKGGKDPLGLKIKRTKTEERMHRLYAQWREEEAKIQKRRLEAAELAEEEEMEMDANGQMQWKSDLDAAGSKGSKKQKKKRKKLVGEVDDGNDDPWAQVAKNRGEVKGGLNDVVQAPPTFTKVPRAKFKELRGAKVEVEDVPKASGSLRRREELGEVRKSIVESYRQMMKENREKAGQ
ncbi:hypothetical protein ACMFMG_002389 [Clarireedia jacksonii]